MSTGKAKARHLRMSDLRAIAQLATQATHAVTGIVEGVHQSVWGTLGMPGAKTPGRTRGVTGMVYRTVGGVTRLVGGSFDAAAGWLVPLLDRGPGDASGTPEREAVLAALNGVMGDHLAATGNPLATPMTLRWQGQVLNGAAAPRVPAATGRVLLLIHGLCMNDLQWRTAPQAQGAGPHGDALAEAHGYTPVHLRYNTGLHVSENGLALASQLEALLAGWPVPLEHLAVVAHSMGGLVIRSAVLSATQQGLRWPQALRHLVFLGTPHHGAPLERAGNWVDVLLGGTPYTAPFARIGQLRSAGITDLRYGHVVDADWRDRDRFRRAPDRRVPVPLPEGVGCRTIAATLAEGRGTLADGLVGDGLVPLHSALGDHADPRRSLGFADASRRIVHGRSHLALLHDPAVTRQIVEWLTPPQGPPGAAPRPARRGSRGSV
jgi:hypothetical protein